MDRRGRDMGALALALLALIWGYNWVVMKVGLQYAQPFTFSALRTLLGAVGLFALLLVLRRPLRPPPLRWTIAIGLLQTTGFVGLMMWALESGGAGKTSVLTYTMPFWLLLLAWAFLGERLRGVQWLAVALALC
jgi:drug/metabolite transporter (DMT)-like permease